MSNAVQLQFHRNTTNKVQARVRANAVFIHAKLVAGGMSVDDARLAVEQLFSDGRAEGYEDGHEDGYEAGYQATVPIGDEGYRD